MSEQRDREEQALKAAIAYLGWQGGTVYHAREALEKRERELITTYNLGDDSPHMDKILTEIALVQSLMLALVDARKVLTAGAQPSQGVPDRTQTPKEEGK